MKFKPAEEIAAFLQQYARPMGIEIVDVVEKDDNLTIIIETEAGVDIDTCEKFHNAKMETIDVPENYIVYEHAEKRYIVIESEEEYLQTLQIQEKYHLQCVVRR